MCKKVIPTQIVITNKELVYKIVMINKGLYSITCLL